MKLENDFLNHKSKPAFKYEKTQAWKGGQKKKYGPQLMNYLGHLFLYQKRKFGSLWVIDL